MFINLDCRIIVVVMVSG